MPMLTHPTGAANSARSQPASVIPKKHSNCYNCKMIIHSNNNIDSLSSCHSVLSGRGQYLLPVKNNNSSNIGACLTTSTNKTKVLVVGRDAAAQNAEPVIVMRGEQLEVVSQCMYLGSISASDCTLDAEITHTVVAANSAFQQLRRTNIWSSRALTLSVEMQFFQCIVMSVLLYSGETWPVVQKHISPWAVFQMNCLRRICGISLRDHGPNVDVLTRCNTFSVESQLQSKRLRWLGHMFRMPDDRLLHKLLFGQVKGRRPPGLP